MTMLIDIHEPRAIVNLCRQSIEVMQSSLNPNLADYSWMCADGHTAQTERKQWSEVLGGLSNVEDQLRRELKYAEELVLLIEGPLEILKDGNLQYKQTRYKISYSLIASWLWSLDKSGITIVQTPNYVGTAQYLVAAYKQSQKPEHTVLERYIRVKKVTTERDPLVLTLMGVQNVNLGEKRAKALAEKFTSIYQIANAEVEELIVVPGIGDVVAKQLLRALGREV